MTLKTKAARQRRRFLETSLNSRYERSNLFYDSELQFHCAYCGRYVDPQTSRGDHVIPLYAMKDIIKIDPNIKSEIVPCCSRCNSISGSILFSSFREKKSYIQSRYEEQHAKKAFHTKEDLYEMGYNLKTMLKKHNAEIKMLLEYSQWDSGYLGEDHRNNKKLEKFFSTYGYGSSVIDPRTKYPTWVSPKEFPRPWNNMKEATELLGLSKNDILSCILAEELEFTIIENKYHLNYYQLLDLKMSLESEEYSIKDLRSIAKTNKKKLPLT